MPRNCANLFKFGDDIWDPSHRFETSWLLPPWVLFGCRAAIVRPFFPLPVVQVQVLEVQLLIFGEI
jgi:hypothetical protein